MHDLIRHLVAGFFAWSLLSLGAAVFGLYSRTGERWRAAWFMTAMWGLVDGAIALYALLGPPLAPQALASILRFNTGLDILYILAGLALLTRKNPRLQGFGLAIIVQGAFLLGFDLYFWSRCVPLIA